eukprot:gene4529-8993_t
MSPELDTEVTPIQLSMQRYEDILVFPFPGYFSFLLRMCPDAVSFQNMNRKCFYPDLVTSEKDEIENITNKKLDKSDNKTGRVTGEIPRYILSGRYRLEHNMRHTDILHR